MAKFILRRLFHAVIVVFVISLLIFFSIRLTGDPVAVMFAAGEPSQQAIDNLTAELGLDQPIWVQYGIFLRDLITFDLGTSFRTGQSVSSMVAATIGPTTLLAAAGMAVAILIAFPVGIVSAVKRGTVLDFGGRMFSLIGISFPNFWLGIMLILIFAVMLGWFPASGYGTPQHFVLPAITLGLILSGILSRLVRSSMLEVLNQQYIATAHSKGLRSWVVIFRHGLRNALIPTVTFMGVQFGGLLAGTVIIEQVFSWPGLGRMIIDAINARDYPVVQGGVIVLALITVAVNLLVDLSYSILNPRIKAGGSDS
ncbi:ABC transporter permease [Nesterenkonia alba]|uniref:ABC transporter permease n=1 Tax=Nesterenkonia alba TaxID=515814 RepID=UPI0003B5E09F|nr:ABC transporter permease [Nesterenkonia alba]